jgi:hypothetical protein
MRRGRAALSLGRRRPRLNYRMGYLLAIVALLAAGCAESSAGNNQTTPTELATATLELTPSPTPARTFTTIKLSGRGDKVPRFTIPADVAAIVTFTHNGSANFIVTSIGADGAELDVLVNEIGTFSGTVLFDTSIGEHSVAFRIQADGAWTATIKPVSGARSWNPTTALAGRGDDVIQVAPTVSGLVTATISHKGAANFIVEAYNGSSVDLLVNEIGNFSGQEILPDGTFLLSVQADGTWTVTPS